MGVFDVQLMGDPLVHKSRLACRKFDGLVRGGLDAALALAFLTTLKSGADQES